MVYSISLKKWTLKAFVMVCFLGVLLPNITLFNEKENEAIVRKENRKITEFPKLDLLQKEFYPKFDNFYQDRLFGREKLIYAWSILNYKGHVMLKDNIVLGKNGHLFDKDMNVIGFKDKNIKFKRIRAIQDYCSNNHADFICIIPPYKNAIYTDYLPKRVSLAVPNYLEFENQVQQGCKDFGINYISLYKPLLVERERSNKSLYFLNDHHWSYEGAAVAVDIILRYIKTKKHNLVFNGLKFDGSFKLAYKESRYAQSLGIVGSRDCRVKAPWRKSFTNQIYGVEQATLKEVCFDKEPVANNYLWSRMVNGEAIIINKNVNNKLKILFLCDSYAGYMAPYISQYVNSIVLTHYFEHSGNKKNTNLSYLLNKYKPDFVILEMVAPGFLKSKEGSKFVNISW